MDDFDWDGAIAKMEGPVLRRNLTRASMFLVAFELLKSDIIDGVRELYLCSYMAGKPGYDERAYQAEVSALAPHRFDACCRWLVGMGAIDDVGLQTLQRIREHRNAIAHELPRYIGDPAFEVDMDLLHLTRYYVGVLGRFWGGIELETDPSEDAEPTEVMSIRSWGMVLLEHVITIAEHPTVQQ